MRLHRWGRRLRCSTHTCRLRWSIPASTACAFTATRCHRRLRHSRQRTRSACVPDADNSLAPSTAPLTTAYAFGVHVRRRHLVDNVDSSLAASTALFHPHSSTALVHTLTGSCGLRRTHERLQHRWHRRLRHSRQRTRSTCIPDAGNSLASTTALWQRRLRCSTHTRRLRWFIHSQAHTLPHKLAASLKSGECCATLPELVDPAVRQQARTTCMILTIVTICSE